VTAVVTAAVIPPTDPQIIQATSNCCKSFSDIPRAPLRGGADGSLPVATRATAPRRHGRRVAAAAHGETVAVVSPTMPAATMPRFLLVLLVVLPHRLPSGVAVPVAAPSREGAAAAAGPGACPSALQAACGSGSTDTILACDVCTGRHQRELRAALCAPSDIEWWCASRVVQNATQRLSAASSALIGAAAAPRARAPPARRRRTARRT